MPTAVVDSRELRRLVRFTSSAPYELLLSLGTVHWVPARHQAWAQAARAALGPDLLADARYFYEELWHPLALMELPVDFPGDPDDVPGFIDYVAAMDGDTFLFYILGRVVPRDDIGRLRAQPGALSTRLNAFYDETWPGTGPRRLEGDPVERVAATPEATQARLVALLRAYWERVFRDALPGLRPLWVTSLAERQQALDGGDPLAFVSRLLDGRTPPAMFPEGTPLREIRIIPSYYTWRGNFEVWGYGSLIVIYNASYSERRDAERAQAADRLSQIAAALADTNRLKILSRIAQDPSSYGHKLAQFCGISQPAVSRHMGILKRAGLVEEVPADGRVAYRLRRATLEDFLPQLLQYIEE